jgi:hypothetical protein
MCKVLLFLAGIALAALIAKEFPALKRELKIWRM